MKRNWRKEIVIVTECGECSEFEIDKDFPIYKCRKTNKRIMNKNQINKHCPLDYVFEQNKEER